MTKRPASQTLDTPKRKATPQRTKPPVKKIAPMLRQLPEATKGKKSEAVPSLSAATRQPASHAVNTQLVGLYGELGRYISRKIATAEWGDGVVDELAATIVNEYPGQRGFSRANLFRMRQFFQTYRDDKKVAPVVRESPWNRQQSRSLSPTLVAEYQTALPSKALLRRKLHELYAQLAPQTDESPTR